MGFDQAHEAMEKHDFNAEPAPEQTPTTPEAVTPEAQAAAPTGTQNLTAQEIVELDKLQKVKWEGKEWSLDDLKKSVMRHSEYTKKTQKLSEEKKGFEEQLRSYEESKKFEDNLEADLQAVRQDPSLAARFREVYPEKYWRFVDHTVSTLDPQAAKVQAPSYDPQVLRKLQELETKLTARERQELAIDLKSKETLLDSASQKCMTKYDMANEEVVLAKAEHLLKQGHFGDPKDPEYTEKFMKGLEALYKQDHDLHMKRYEDRYRKQIETQKQANGRAKDIAPGGGTPGRAPEKVSLKGVRQQIDEHYSKQA